MPTLRTLLASGAAAALAAGAAGCNNSSSAKTPPPHQTRRAQAPAAGTVKGTLNEWTVGVSATRATAGNVTFDVSNSGKLKHEFVVLRTDKPAADLGTGRRISEAGHVGETGDIAPGQSKSVTLRLAPGHYSLVCNLPGHYHAGMHADFTVS